MTAGSKIALISISIIGIGTAVYFIFFRKKDKPDEVVGPVVPEQETIIKKKETVIKEKKSNPKRYTTESSPLTKYDYGQNVKCLQKLLNWRGYTDDDGKVLVLDGKWGNSTQEALNKSNNYMALTTNNGTTVSLSKLRDFVGYTPGTPLPMRSYLKDMAECSNASCCANVVQDKSAEEGNRKIHSLLLHIIPFTTLYICSLLSQ